MSNVYVGYSPNDFFYQTTKNVVTSDYHPTQQECKNIIENANIVSSLPYLNKKDCTSYFGDNKIECIKSKICLNEQSVNQINSQDVEHNSAYAKNTDNSVEFQDTFLNTVNLSLGILFIVFVIFKIQSIAKK